MQVDEAPDFPTLALEEFQAHGYEARLNIHRTHVQLKYCPFCGNERWNLDIELSSLFVYSCWACNTSGLSAVFLQKLKFRLRVPLPSGEKLIRPTRATNIYFNYPFFPRAESPVPLHSTRDIKVISPKKPVYYGGQKIRNGIMMLGHLGRGVLIADSDTKQVRKTGADIFLFSDQSKYGSVAVVESFFDIYPFFEHIPVLVLGGTSLPKTIYDELARIMQPEQLLLALDKDAEKPAKYQFQRIFITTTTLLLKPEKHSPAESKYLYLHSTT